MKFNFLRNVGWTSNHKPFYERGVMKLSGRWRRCIEVQGECAKNKYYFCNKFIINFFHKKSQVCI